MSQSHAPLVSNLELPIPYNADQAFKLYESQDSNADVFDTLLAAVQNRIGLPDHNARSARESKQQLASVETDATFWRSIADSKQIDDHRAYLRRFPNGEFRELAEKRIESQQNIFARIARNAPLVIFLGAALGTTAIGFVTVDKWWQERATTQQPKVVSQKLEDERLPTEAARIEAQKLSRAGEELESGKWETVRVEKNYFEIAERLESSGNFSRAVEFYLIAAEQGHPEAQYKLSFLYLMGSGVEQDEKQSAKWVRKAAEQGHREAQNELGIMLSLGRGVRKDDAEGARWFEKAAEQGSPKAQLNLAAAYAKGSGVEQDEKQSAKWVRKAAEQGLPDAQYALGFLYNTGEGVLQDHNQAAKWFRKAEHLYQR